ncbi:hypothetical protein N7457_004652 [Penicillium paradoxum]|uniref:uncharacterized protein n=1 Tax=Penicillium paradoxum TaxID=176176 RepID=UPI0025499117|nr:uncharacterized protein N7457_004652 [Penicillium paradoxum]KAJ5782878.1 hypothetical protein N7457_004652 [Penicillium paradoxum]
MWWHCLVSVLLSVSVLGVQAVPTIGQLFTLLEGTGACEDDHVGLMNQHLTDVRSLATAFSTAITEVTNDPSGKDGTVARKLFETWLGIPLDEDGNALSNVAQWERVKEPPGILCDGTGFAGFEWDDSIERWDPETHESFIYVIDDEEPSIGDIYGFNPDFRPYLLENNHHYYAAIAGHTQRDMCLRTDGTIGYGVTFPGRAETIMTYLAQPLQMDGVQPLVVMCPYALETTSLHDILTGSVNYEEGVTQLSALVLRAIGPTTLFHELIHMVSFWDETGGGKYVLSPDYITDYTYDAAECLYMAFQGVYLSIPQHDGTFEQKFFGPEDASRNAHTYTFFAWAYWYYTATGNEYTFYEGVLVPWDVDLFAGADAGSDAGSDTGSDTGSTKRSFVSGNPHYSRRFGKSHHRAH